MGKRAKRKCRPRTGKGELIRQPASVAVRAHPGEVVLVPVLGGQPKRVQGSLEERMENPEQGVHGAGPCRHRARVGGLATHRDDVPQHQKQLFFRERLSVLFSMLVWLALFDWLIYIYI